MNQHDFNNYMNKKQPFLEIVLSPSHEVAIEVNKHYEFITGTDDIFEDKDLFDKLYLEACIVTCHKNISMNEAEVIAEPIRIAHPNQNVNITDRNGNTHNHVTWNDQMEMFFDYPTFTQQGLAIATMRQLEAIEQGVLSAGD